MYFSGTTVDFGSKTLQNVFKTFLKRFLNGLKRHKENQTLNRMETRLFSTGSTKPIKTQWVILKPIKTQWVKTKPKETQQNPS
jgi:hypothetical protein